MADSRAIAAKKDGKKRGLGGRDRRLRSAAPTAVPTAMRNVLPGGQSLPTDMRDEMERHFGEAFADVRIHVGAEAAASAAARGASAYTIGSHIVFGHERWEPGTAQGHALLAHELAHVVQQRKSAYMPVATGQSLEADADRAAAAEQRGADVGLAAAAGSVQCAPEEEKSDIRIVPDPGARKIRVVRVDKQGKIIAGLAEITPSPGEVAQTERVSATREQAAGAKHRYVVGVPEGWKGTKNPSANVSLEASDEVNFSGVSITSGNEEDRFNTDDAVLQFLEETNPNIAMYFSHGSELSGIRDSKEFAAWKKMKVAKRQQEQQQTQTESENRYYQMALYRQSGQMYSGKEAREIWETYNRDSATEWEKGRIASNTLPNEIRDEKDGTRLGYRLYEYKEKYLAGGVGTVTEIILDRDGNEIQRHETTVLTPETDFAQSVARGAPIVGNAINYLEAESGRSLDLRDPGRKLSKGEVIDRSINVIPGVDTARTAMEVATGVDLSDAGIDAQLRDEVITLSDRQRLGKASLLVVEGAGAVVGARIKIKPKLKLKAPDAPKLKKPLPTKHKPPNPIEPAQQRLPSSNATQPSRTNTVSDATLDGPTPASAVPTKGESPAVEPAPLHGAKRPPESAQTRKQKQGLKNVEPGKSEPIPIERARRAPPKEPTPNEPQAIKREATNDAPVEAKPPPKLEVVRGGKDSVGGPDRVRASASESSGGKIGEPASTAPRTSAPGADPPAATHGRPPPGRQAAESKSLADVKAKNAERVAALEKKIAELDREIAPFDEKIGKVRKQLDETQAELRKLGDKAGSDPRVKKLIGRSERLNQQLLQLQSQRAKPATMREAAIADLDDAMGVTKMPAKGGGSHGGVRGRTKGEGGQVNHIPAWDSYKGEIDLGYSEGPGIWMTAKDHGRLKSTGSSDAAVKYRAKQRELISQGRFDEAVEMDIRDIREQIPDRRYDGYIAQMRNYISRLDRAKLKPRGGK